MGSAPSIDHLRKRVRYEPETGHIYWISGPYYRQRAFANANSKGHLKGKMDGWYLMAARVAWALHYGEWPKSVLLHLDDDKSNNKIENLFDASHSCVPKTRQDPIKTKSGIVGVTWHKKSQGWQARIKINGKSKFLGIFDKKEDAISARLKSERERYPNKRPHQTIPHVPTVNSETP